MSSNRVLAQIEALRKAMAGADGKQEGTFGDVFSAFFDIAEDSALFEAHKPAKEPVIRDVLEQTTRHLTGADKITLQGVQMFRVAAAGFVHGAFFAPPYMASFFYFDREKQGLVAYHGGGTGTSILRITLAEVPEGVMPMKKPSGLH